MLVKRLAFRHEREVRLLFFHPGAVPTPGLFQYGVNPHELIDQIMIDPWMPTKKALVLIDQIKEKTGYNGEIKRSLLYTPLNVS